MVAKAERFELRLEADLIERIDQWRDEQGQQISRSEAVRQLVSAGLGKPADRQLFQIARFNVLTAARAPDSAIPHDYAHAWRASVYPSFSSSGLHVPFADQFEIPGNRVEELAKLLDEAWLRKDVPSFYKLETLLDVRRGGGFWDRSKLIDVCRYLFLHGMFDGGFWKSLLIGSDHPVEAQSINRKFVPVDDIYFA